jgi:hypothetical protein
MMMEDDITPLTGHMDSPDTLEGRRVERRLICGRRLLIRELYQGLFFSKLEKRCGRAITRLSALHRRACRIRSTA